MTDSFGSIEMAVKRVRRKCVNRKCVHGKRKSRCSHCGGTSLCCHGVRKYSCKPCGGKGICVHGKQKSFCLDCGGRGLCVHGKIKHSCFPCGGKRKCPHNHVRGHCAQCGVIACSFCWPSVFFSSINLMNKHLRKLHLCYYEDETFKDVPSESKVVDQTKEAGHDDSNDVAFGELEALDDEEYERRLTKAFSEQP